MILPLTDAELLARSQRRRRWVVPVALVSLLILLLLIFAGLALISSSGLSIELAKESYQRLRGDVTKEQAESILGKPLLKQVRTGYTLYAWIFTSQSIDRIDAYSVFMALDDGRNTAQLLDQEWSATGAGAWNYRWWMLKYKLGLNPDEWP